MSARERAVTAAELVVTAPEAVRGTRCDLCWALPGKPCRRAFLGRPAADHLSRWLASYTAGRISRDDLIEVIGQVVVITKWQIIAERAA